MLMDALNAAVAATGDLLDETQRSELQALESLLLRGVRSAAIESGMENRTEWQPIVQQVLERWAKERGAMERFDPEKDAAAIVATALESVELLNEARAVAAGEQTG